MKIFIDTANLNEIKEANAMGLLDGVTTNPSLVAKEGKEFRQLLDEIHKNIVVKVPLIKEGLKAVKTFTAEGIKTNVTLCFSASQAVLAAKAGASYISPFVGRLDDISADGMELISQIVQIYNNYAFNTEVLVASVRHPLHFVDACLIGADVCTIPFKVIESLFNHPLTDIGLQKFLADHKKSAK
ncbi:MAG: transaldolase family protein [Ignavibacteriales bacterium]|nr:transaldolase family protein [Ignavibacteriales bacterium]